MKKEGMIIDVEVRGSSFYDRGYYTTKMIYNDLI